MKEVKYLIEEDKNLVNEIQQSFLNLLKDYLPKSLLEKTNLKILSICCGRFREAKSIFDYFSPNEKFVKLYGIEIDKDLLNLANEEQAIKNNSSNVFLQNADATKIENYTGWLTSGLFDLIIVRHPEITFNTDVFMKIFSLCKRLLQKGSYLLITTHFEGEKEAIKLLLKLYKFNLLTDIENIQAPRSKVGTETRFADKFLLVLTK